MFIERLLNQGNASLLGQTMRFTQARHQLLMDNVANVSTPGFQQKDLSTTAFQAMLRDRLEAKNAASPGTVVFEDVMPELENPTTSLLFHDGNNRSMEQLMTDGAKNALMHNFAVELLRKSYGSIDSALKERVT